MFGPFMHKILCLPPVMRLSQCGLRRTLGTRLVRAPLFAATGAGPGWTAGNGARHREQRRKSRRRRRESWCEAVPPSRDGMPLRRGVRRRPAPAVRTLSGVRPRRQRMTRAPTDSAAPQRPALAAPPSNPDGWPGGQRPPREACGAERSAPEAPGAVSAAASPGPFGDQAPGASLFSAPGPPPASSR